MAHSSEFIEQPPLAEQKAEKGGWKQKTDCSEFRIHCKEHVQCSAFSGQCQNEKA
jgi:hypothetical protein